MSTQEVIRELKALEKKAYSLRIALEGVNLPAPTGAAKRKQPKETKPPTPAQFRKKFREKMTKKYGHATHI